MSLPDYVTVGAHSYFADLKFIQYGKERITIGKYCSIAQGVRILAGGNHRTTGVTTYPLDTMLSGGLIANGRSYEPSQDTVIENDVWIGYGAHIAGGAHIMSGAVVAAGAVVFGVVPPYAIAVGNPARVNKYRFSDGVIGELLKIAWWDWPEELVRERLEKFYQPVGEFVREFGLNDR